MNRLSKADQFLLQQVQAGDQRAWSDLVERYQGRLIAFARQRLRDHTLAEDVVQDTFVSCLTGLTRFRGECGLETFLFVILRRKIIDQMRGKKLHFCRLEDTLGSDNEDGLTLAAIAAVDPVVGTSWYAKENERQSLQDRALTTALTELIDELKQTLDFRAIKLTELLFYCTVPPKQIAQMLEIPEPTVRSFKHRYLKRIKTRTQQLLGPDYNQTDSDTWRTEENADSIIRDIWQTQRPSCPKRSTLGAHILGTLEPEWDDYIDFHLNVLGCECCNANADDIRAATDEAEHQQLQDRILKSTVGFLNK